MIRQLLLLSTLAAATSCDAGGAPPRTGIARLELADGARQRAEVEPGALAAEVAVVVDRGEITSPSDLDEDGFSGDVDPDDENPFVFPGASEEPCDGFDQDGDSVDPCPADVDGDGARADLDCNDLDAAVGPHAHEVSCNGLDENCDGLDDCDRDDDGVLDRDDLDPDDPVVGREERAPEPHAD